MDIGSKGLQEVNLTIPQATSLTFTVVHKDDQGQTIDHSGSTAAMAIQTKDKQTTYDMDAYCTCAESGIYVSLPSTATGALPLGKYNWDLIVTQSNGSVVRLCYGIAQVVDTYALDDED